MSFNAKDTPESPVMLEDAEKDVYSVTSGDDNMKRRPYFVLNRSPYLLELIAGQSSAAGIDAEVANFFSQEPSGVVIDDETNKRLRWMVHKRVLTVMIVTYFAQTLDKGYVRFYCCPDQREL